MAERPPQVVVIAGPNGAGKSASAPAVLRGVRGITEFVNADDIARGLSGFNVEGAAIAADRFGLVFLWLPSPEYVVARVAERVRRGGHNIPAETVRRRYFAGLRNFFELYQPIADSWLCLDNRAGFKTKPIAAGTQAARQSYRGMARRPRGLDPARRN